jgi:hypothetical protein
MPIPGDQVRGMRQPRRSSLDELDELVVAARHPLTPDFDVRWDGPELILSSPSRRR